MGIRDAFSSVPAKPIIAATIGFTVLAASWHGWSVSGICSTRSDLSTALQDWANEVVSGVGIGYPLEFQANFEWDQVRISQGSETPIASQNCPFGWHWSNEERAEMADAGNLTEIGFFKDGWLVGVVDFDRRWADFDTEGGIIDRDQAVFVAAPGSNFLQLSNSSLGN